MSVVSSLTGRSGLSFVSPMRPVSEVFDMVEVRKMSEKVVLSAVTCLERIGHEVPNEVPSYLLDDMVDECIMELMCELPRMSDMVDMLGLCTLSDVCKKWEIAVKCGVMAEMYAKLGMSKESQMWSSRRDAKFEQFAGMIV